MLKRIIALILVLLMLLTCAVACKKDGEQGDDAEGADGSSVTTSGTEEEETDKYAVTDSVGTRDYGGRTVVLGQIQAKVFEADLTQENLTGDIVQDAVYKRTQTVQSRLNVKLDTFIVEKNGELVSTIESDISGDTKSFDIMFEPYYTLTGAITRGFYRDLYESADIDLSQDYWSYYANEQMNIGGIQYFVTGPITLSYYMKTFCTVVNSDLLSEHSQGNPPNLIEVVKSGGWTMEYQKTLAEKVHKDDGDGEKDFGDIAGFCGSSYGSHLDCYLPAFKISFLKKNANGYLEVALDTGRYANGLEAIKALHECSGAVLSTEGDPIPEIGDTFATKHAVMATMMFSDITDKLSELDDPYLILPIPKLDGAQDKYYTALHDSAIGVCVPVTVKKADMEVMGAVIEVMASTNYNLVTPAYYEVVLKTRSTDSLDNWEILDEMMDNALLDPATPFTYVFQDGYSPIGWFRRNVKASVGGQLTSTYSDPNRLIKMQANADTLNNYYKSVNGDS